MKQLIVLCDMDDILLDLIPLWINDVNKLFGTSVTFDDIKSWNIEQFFPSLTRDEVYSPLFAKGFWERIQPTEDGQWFVNKVLGDNHRIKIVTATFYQNVAVKMERFFELYPALTWKDITITSDKQAVKGDVLIDDYHNNLIGGDYSKILKNAPYNQECFKEHGIIRINNLTEAYNIIAAMSA